MKNDLPSLLNCPFVFVLFCAFLQSCQQSAPSPEDLNFFKQKNAEHNGDYLATYPFSSPDSCIAKLKAEVPLPYQPYGCLGLWYRLPRTSQAVSFRLLELYEENYPHDTVTAFAQMMRAEWYVNLAKHDSARICLKDAYERYLALGRPLDASDATMLTGRSYLYQANHAAAVQAYLDVLNLLNSADTSFTERHSMVYGELGTAYERSGDRKNQLKWKLKAWHADHSKLANPIGYKMRVANALCIYYLKSDADSSLYWANLSYELSRQNTQTTAMSPTSIPYALARAHFKKGNCSEAVNYFRAALSKANRDTPIGYYQICRSLGEAFLCTNQLDSANHYAKLALATPDTMHLSEVKRVLGKAHAQAGDWKRAYEAALESKNLYEVGINFEKTKAIEVLSAQYETATKERQLMEAKARHTAEIQQKWIILLVALLLIGLVAGLYLRQRSRRVILEQDHQLLQQERALIETQAQLQKKELEQSKEALEKADRLLAVKNKIIEELHLRLHNGQEKPPDDQAERTDINLESFRSMKILTKEDWRRFKELFDQAFPNYLQQLSHAQPTLTNAEIRLVLLLKLNFLQPEIAETLGISGDSVLRSRRRLSQKLGLPDSRHLLSFVQDFGTEPKD